MPVSAFAKTARQQAFDPTSLPSMRQESAVDAIAFSQDSGGTLLIR